MVARASKKLKVTSKEDRDKKARERERNSQYFEKFMLEIGQWEKTEIGIVMCGSYISSEEIKTRFKSWLKK